MNNVTTLPAAQPPDAGQKSSQPPNPIAVLQATLDKVLGEKWSFDLVHHEVAGDETIVFVRLAIDGRFRIGIGGTTEKGALVHRLNAATTDALVRASEWLGVAVVQPALSLVPDETGQGTDTGRITRKQLDYALSLARDRGITRDKLVARCLADWKKKPEYLTRAEASELIEALREVA